MKKYLLIYLTLLPVFFYGQTSTTFSNWGNSTFIVPAGITSLNVQTWGAGGAGGGTTSPTLANAETRGAAGGGGGAFASRTALTVTLGQTLQVVVGRGGLGSSGNNGGNGGFSTITQYSTLIYAAGGSGGARNNGTVANPLGGAGGTVAASIGTTRFAGVSGENGATDFGAPSGAGGAGANGGGAGGARIDDFFVSSAGTDGEPPGGGGGGGRSVILGGNRSGGAGGDGRVIITYTCPTYSLTSTVASAVNVCSGDASEITLTGTLPVGRYNVSYEIQGIAQTPAPMNVTAPGGTGSFIATGFTEVGTRSIKITALSSGSSANDAENCVSNLNTGNIATVTVNSSGTAPVALAGTGATCNQITANWEAVSGASYYELDVSTVNTFASFVAGYEALNVGNVLTYNITGLGTATYYYRVRAHNTACTSANSNTITYATAVVPGTVASSNGTAAICNVFTANWTALAGATSYLLEVSTSNLFPSFVLSSDVGNVTSYQVTGLSTNTQYFYRVKAKNGCGTSAAYSTVRNITTSGTIPGDVTSNTANNILCNSFNARWGSPSGAISYLLDVSTVATFATFVTGFQARDVGNTNSFVVTGLTGNTQYYYRLKAKNGCGESVNFSTIQTPKTGMAVPAAPTLTSTSVLCNEITFSWNSTTGTTDYTLQISTNNTFPTSSVTQTITGITAISYTFTGLTAGTIYYSRVLARNGCTTNDGSSSAVITRTTINPATAPTVTIALGALTICQTDVVRFTSSLAPTSYTYLWSTGQTTRSIDVSSDGTYTVQFIRAGGCSSASSIPRVVTIQDLPTAVAGGSQTICSNGSALVSGASASNGTIKWTFSGGSGTLTNDATIAPTFTPTLGGAARTIVLTMTVTSNNSCAPQIATATYTVYVQAAPTIVISGSQNICQNESATVAAGEADAANGTVLWTHDGAGTISGATTLTPTYNSVTADAGKQVTLTLTVTASPSCTTPYRVSDTYAVVVLAQNTVEAASSLPSVCINSVMTNVTHNTTGATGIGTAADLPAGVSAVWASDVITISGTPTTTGVFNYSIPLIGGCGTLNATGTITVKELPATPISGALIQPTCVNPKGSVVLSGLIGSASSVIHQQGPSSQSYPVSTTEHTITNLDPGIYTFTIEDGVGCPSLPTVSIEIIAPIVNTWNGSVWSEGSVPTNDTDGIVFSGDYQSIGDLTGCSCQVALGKKVTINSGHTLTLQNGINVNTGAGTELVFENNASLVQINDVVNTGSIIYKRNTTAVRRYDQTFWSSPVTRVPAFTLHDLSPNTLRDKYYKYDPIADNWVVIEMGAEEMGKGIGYNIRAPQSHDINTPTVFNGAFNGVPNNGPVSIALGGLDNWVLLGNPYPSAVYADEFIVDNEDNLLGTLYFWTHNSLPSRNFPGPYQINYNADDYALYNLTGGIIVATGATTVGNQTPPSGYIAAGQAFFAQSKTALNAVFTNSMRVPAFNSQFFKTVQSNKTAIEKHRVWLNLSNKEGVFKQLLIGYITGATNSWDNNYDGLTLDSNQYIDFYSIDEDRKLVVQGRAIPFNESDILPLGYKSTIAGEFSISIDHADGDLSTHAIYLEDKASGILYDLRTANYTFTTATGTFNDRFTLRFADKTLGTADLENPNNAVVVSVKDKIIKIASGGENIKEVVLFDVSGKMLYDKNKIGTSNLVISNLQSSNQVLLVKITLENGSLIDKKIIFF